MCVFCQIIRKEAPAHIVYENEKVIVFLDLEPIHDGHVLVVPKYHESTITAIPTEYLTEVLSVAKKIVRVYEEDYGHRGYSMMQNGGECCDFGHYHMHVFPRIADDGFGFTYPEQGGNYTEEVAKDLHEKMQKKEV